MELTIIILGISRWEHEDGQPTAKSLVRLHGCTGWPGSILVAKTYCFCYQKDNCLLKYSLKSYLHYFSNGVKNTLTDFARKHFYNFESSIPFHGTLFMFYVNMTEFSISICHMYFQKKALFSWSAMCTFRKKRYFADLPHVPSEKAPYFPDLPHVLSGKSAIFADLPHWPSE